MRLKYQWEALKRAMDSGMKGAVGIELGTAISIRGKKKEISEVLLLLGFWVLGLGLSPQNFQV